MRKTGVRNIAATRAVSCARSFDKLFISINLIEIETIQACPETSLKQKQQFLLPCVVLLHGSLHLGLCLLRSHGKTEDLLAGIKVYA